MQRNEDDQALKQVAKELFEVSIPEDTHNPTRFKPTITDPGLNRDVRGGSLQRSLLLSAIVISRKIQAIS